MLETDFSENDIVIIITLPLICLKKVKENSELRNKCIIKKRFVDSFIDKSNEKLNDCYLDHLGHHNYYINKIEAQKIFKDISQFLKRPYSYYIPIEIMDYYESMKVKNGISIKQEKCSAIVMNCNPFTKGHRYLIETACKYVDKLYVFVVEEDASYFSFEDRYNMVKLGCEDLTKVTILPSGKYLISKLTFPQYFEKDNISCIENMEYDVIIFTDVVANVFNIKIRFVGEEPLDQITNAYNCTMKKILPVRGIEVIEVPRLSSEEGEIISASIVRKMIKTGKADELKSLLPISTLKYLHML